MEPDILIDIFKRAWDYADRNSKDGDGRHGHLYRGKLTELLINECADVCYTHAQGLFEHHFPNYQYAAQCGDLIKEHFGFE